MKIGANGESGCPVTLMLLMRFGLYFQINKRIRIAYIEAAKKRTEEFEKRLNNFINKTKENKAITGFGGIEKYY